MMKGKKILVGSIIAGIAVMMTLLSVTSYAIAQEVNCYPTFTPNSEWTVGVPPDLNENGIVCEKIFESNPPGHVIMDDRI